MPEQVTVTFKWHLFATRRAYEALCDSMPINLILAEKDKTFFDRVQAQYVGRIATNTGQCFGEWFGEPSFYETSKQRSPRWFCDIDRFSLKGCIHSRHEVKELFVVGALPAALHYVHRCQGYACSTEENLHPEYDESEMEFVDMPDGIAGWYCKSCAFRQRKQQRKEIKKAEEMTLEKLFQIIAENEAAWQKKEDDKAKFRQKRMDDEL